MIKKSKLSTIMFSLIFCLIAIFPVQADIGQMIQDGIDYLELNQDETSDISRAGRNSSCRVISVGRESC